MLALDTSGSMRALDFQLNGEPVTRLSAVKWVVAEFIKKRETDRIGLVVFGEETFTQSPLTMDKGLLLELVDKMEIGMAGDRTALGEALAIGAKRLKNLKAKSRILVLLTDGRHNAGDITPDQVAEAVRTLAGIKIYTIGVGGKGPAPFEVKTAFSSRIVHQRVDLDEATTIAHLWVLNFLWLLPLVIVALIFDRRQKRRWWAQFAQEPLLPRLTGAEQRGRSFLKGLLRIRSSFSSPMVKTMRSRDPRRSAEPSARG
jgi:hypothetical protein